MGNPGFWVAVTPNSLTNRLKIWHGWLRRRYDPTSQKLKKIGLTGSARQRGEMWRSNAVILYFIFYFIIFIVLLARLWRPHFCTDRHRFCVRWRVSVGIDFLECLIVRVKIFALRNPQTPIFGPISDLENFAWKRFTMAMLQSKLPLITIVAPWKLYSE